MEYVFLLFKMMSFNIHKVLLNSYKNKIINFHQIQNPFLSENKIYMHQVKTLKLQLILFCTVKKKILIFHIYFNII